MGGDRQQEIEISGRKQQREGNREEVTGIRQEVLECRDGK